MVVKFFNISKMAFKMNTPKQWFHFLIVIGLLIAGPLIHLSCNSEGQSKDTNSNTNEAAEAEAEDSTLAIPVEIAAAERGDISAFYTNTATLEAEVEADVVAKVRGIVHHIQVEEGDYVQQGDVLVQLEDEQLEIEVQRAEATMNKLKNEYERNKKLFDKQLISAEAFENARFEYESQKAAHELAALNLRNTKIRTPIEGIVSERMIKRGATVDQNQEVFRITDFTPLLAVLHVPEHEMNKIAPDQTALFQVDARQGEQFEGYVQRISPVVNPETGTFKVTVAVEDESRRLRPGMFARISIVYDQHQNTILIPKQAVIQEDNEQYVFLINNKRAFKKPVKTGYINNSDSEIVQGLQHGDQVVTIGHTSLQDSSKVNIVQY